MYFRKHNNRCAITISLILLLTVQACRLGSEPSKKNAPAPPKKQAGDDLNPVIDKKTPGYVPKPSMLDLPVGMGSGVTHLELYSSDTSLGPLPLPSSELGEALPNIFDTLGRPPEFDPIVLSALRKKVDGTIIYEDAEQNLWKVQPKKSGPVKIFRGSHPAGDPARGRVIYVDWDMKYVYVCVFDFKTAVRSTIYSGADPIARPSLSPDGRYAAFIVKSMSGGGMNLYRVDLQTKSVRALTKNISFVSYSWNPADSSIWISVRRCPDEAPRGNFCYGRIDPLSGKMEFGALSIKYPARAERVPIDSFGKPAIHFSPDGRLLIYDAEEANDYFFEVDTKTQTAEKLSFKKPDGSSIMPRNLQSGPRPGFYSMELKGNVWVKIPDEEQPFPVAGNFSASGPVAWIP